MNDKVKPQHLERKAVVYVRQSSAYQVAHNEESRRLQYAMRTRLEELGWREIEIIDDDLGCSARGVVVRTGFDRMVADVCLGTRAAAALGEDVATGVRAGDGVADGDADGRSSLSVGARSAAARVVQRMIRGYRTPP